MFKRTLSLLLCLLVAVPSLAFCAFAQENEVSPAEISYEITDPYACLLYTSPSPRDA